MSRLQLAIEQITFARTYTIRLLDQTKTEDWFRQPPGGVSHFAWQVGHLAMAQYRLALERIRGAQPQDHDLIAESFLRLFGRESVPDADPGKYPNQAEIRVVFDRVHQQVLRELAGLDESELDQPVLKPHRLAKTKLWALLWCAQHEMVHAGQMGLLRRQLGVLRCGDSPTCNGAALSWWKGFRVSALVGGKEMKHTTLALSGFLLLITAATCHGADENEKVLFEEKFASELGPGWSWVRAEPKAWKIEKNILLIRTLPGYLHANSQPSCEFSRLRCERPH